MKYIKKREIFLNESKDIIKNDALDILSKNSSDQDPELQKVLTNLDQASTTKKVVTRFAPSPTGFLHIGGIRTALYNYLFAKKHDGLFYLRIEDTDQKRYVGEAEKYIKEALEWCGISPDYAPWNPGPSPYDKMRQSERDYTKHTQTLIDKGMAYYAFDTEADIQKERNDNLTPDGKNSTFAYDAKSRGRLKNSLTLSKTEVDELIKSGHPYVIRFKTPENKTIVFKDIIRGSVSFNTNQTDDKVLIKSNGIPTYHMANVCDDHDMGTTHVIRGEEWLPSTPLHILLYEAFGWERPEFAHLPLLLNPDGKGKLSKRNSLKLGIPVFPMGGEGEDDKGTKVKYKGFKDEGFEPDALMNFLLMLGWAPDNNREMYSLADMISNFSLDRVHKGGARFDINKAKFFNKSYMSDIRTNDEVRDQVDFGDTHYSDETKEQILTIARQRGEFRKDMQKIVDVFIKPVVISDEDRKKTPREYDVVFNDLLNLDTVDWNDSESVRQSIYDICVSKGVKMNKIMPSLRIALTGGIPGPDLMTTISILGEDESKKRILELL